MPHLIYTKERFGVQEQKSNTNQPYKPNKRERKIKRITGELKKLKKALKKAHQEEKSWTERTS